MVHGACQQQHQVLEAVKCACTEPACLGTSRSQRFYALCWQGREGWGTLSCGEQSDMGLGGLFTSGHLADSKRLPASCMQAPAGYAAHAEGSHSASTER